MLAPLCKGASCEGDSFQRWWALGKVIDRPRFDGAQGKEKTSGLNNSMRNRNAKLGFEQVAEGVEG